MIQVPISKYVISKHLISAVCIMILSKKKKNQPLCKFQNEVEVGLVIKEETYYQPVDLNKYLKI